jgi:sodium-type flagellar protein MotY
MKATTSLLAAFTLLTLAWATIQGAETNPREYMATLHDAKWVASSSDGECLLQQDIPGFGNSQLRQSAQEPLRFELHITQEVDMGTQCTVAISPPPWRHGVSSTSLGVIKIVPDAKHLQAKGGAAQTIYQGLESGMQTSFNCQDQKNPLANIRVVVSPVRYLIALPEFQRCVAALESETKVAAKPANKSSKKKITVKPEKKAKKK